MVDAVPERHMIRSPRPVGGVTTCAAVLEEKPHTAGRCEALNDAKKPNPRSPYENIGL